MGYPTLSAQASPPIRNGTYAQIVYSPTGDKIEAMNGQSVTEIIVPLPGGALAANSSAGPRLYHHPDHLGSARFVSTSSRTMYYDGAFAPFGEPYAQSGTTDLSFTGMNQGTASGLYDFPAREYSIQGRWPSPDPAGLAAVDPTNPQSWNRYAYVLNNPMNSVDPSGLCEHMLYDDASCFAGYIGFGPSMTCNLYVWMWDSWDSGTGHYEGMLCGGGGGGGSRGGGNSGTQRSAPPISPGAQACVSQANQQIQNQLQTFSGYAGSKLIGRAALGAFSGALTSFRRFSKTGNPWVVATGAAVGASIGAGSSILSDVLTIQKIQNSFMDKFVACMQNASVPTPPE